ncbi:hypothetical protein BB562_07185 [Lactiplantibacillus pentosus]|uniref:Uncharacterized protein n=1 Tax=Lactiplantibacillus pentosus TaxID=1589 RepID=A0AAW8VSI5_LACPE|nr:hypothetical protein [Lactiplantibacillus pentosus]AUI78481.1 hypothetical protein BB562_07185 [Lactiplantibacillus pentosus]MBU7474564.1 hypothetical protein [Lactiplantibacillus pentosus]MCT3278803.1 hypothetical protein [Lactiplantibacillus pentosus]MDT6988531.1 hypothetical protein [Lactiplantibacillus pentosus]
MQKVSILPVNEWKRAQKKSSLVSANDGLLEVTMKHAKFLKHTIDEIWVSDTESLSKLYKMLDKNEMELNKLRGLK